MFLHKHPYEPFIRNDTTKLIVGTLPPPRFSVGELLEKDVNFCYGSYYNSLWLYIDKIHRLNFRYDNSNQAIKERKDYLIEHKIGICDIVESAERKKIDASDLGMSNIKLRDLVGFILRFPRIDTILFTGGNSKNGPEYFFRRHLKSYGLKLHLIENEIPRIHEFRLDDRRIRTVSLTSCSGAANISVSRNPLFQQLKLRNPDFNTFDFRILQYQEYL
ncbi:uracil-DNA glycosylase family protein [Psychroserpens sp.]|uniref:uracil-DNA glycosylase family protein n=1 Tax=Psychroserpens sp. TaxID=2020870 RepID=UPI001B185FFD|nr:uracil-DNA glycosylase family protein [Psychroserpens sp.]MBO6606028.1 uracil-DNA glycosylase family protein [Psychroserpens sp.]MBO6630334.1 uracil-DNA glycosylase family protein [Psychroserpens sp.]MBO6652601.1 uracil-DNA glycosylase family protein [Psychroserpens sp.]MBO6681627.1 uracil-DNA glycosylase family protein [Psychroserpens sp.]MBO6749402.1 uracil-DNA glycosylase family protein [Psychroserpens sp.]